MNRRRTDDYRGGTYGPSNKVTVLRPASRAWKEAMGQKRMTVLLEVEVVAPTSELTREEVVAQSVAVALALKAVDVFEPRHEGYEARVKVNGHSPWEDLRRPEGGTDGRK
jgi:hypothetical protein